MKLEERLWKQFNKALGQYQLIDDGDHILVGLSGGKDSLMLLEFLARRVKIHVPRFTVSALHVRMGNVSYETDTSYLQHFCSSAGVPLHIVTTCFEPAVAEEAATRFEPAAAEEAATRSAIPSSGTKQKQKPTCFLCSWHRRKQLFNVAQELGCTKIALGHHQDDIIHTALMNLVFQGHFSTMPARLRMRKMPLTIIRPLCLCREDDIRQYAESRHYEKQLKHCPYEHATNRTAARQLFEHIQQLNTEARYCLWNALEADGRLADY